MLFRPWLTNAKGWDGILIIITIDLKLLNGEFLHNKEKVIVGFV